MIFAITLAMVSFHMFGAFITIMQVGKKREPITPGVAALTVIFSALIIAGVLYLASN